MFLLPAYDPTAMAMLGFGILAVLGLPFILPFVRSVPVKLAHRTYYPRVGR